MTQSAEHPALRAGPTSFLASLKKQCCDKISISGLSLECLEISGTSTCGQKQTPQRIPPSPPKKKVLNHFGKLRTFLLFRAWTRPLLKQEAQTMGRLFGKGRTEGGRDGGEKGCSQGAGNRTRGGGWRTAARAGGRPARGLPLPERDNSTRRPGGEASPGPRGRSRRRNATPATRAAAQGRGGREGAPPQRPPTGRSPAPPRPGPAPRRRRGERRGTAPRPPLHCLPRPHAARGRPAGTVPHGGHLPPRRAEPGRGRLPPPRNRGERLAGRSAWPPSRRRLRPGRRRKAPLSPRPRRCWRLAAAAAPAARPVATAAAAAAQRTWSPPADKAPRWGSGRGAHGARGPVRGRRRRPVPAAAPAFPAGAHQPGSEPAARSRESPAAAAAPPRRAPGCGAGTGHRGAPSPQPAGSGARGSGAAPPRAGARLPRPAVRRARWPRCPGGESGGAEQRPGVGPRCSLQLLVAGSKGRRGGHRYSSKAAAWDRAGCGGQAVASRSLLEWNARRTRLLRRRQQGSRETAPLPGPPHQRPSRRTEPGMTRSCD